MISQRIKAIVDQIKNNSNNVNSKLIIQKILLELDEVKAIAEALEHPNNRITEVDLSSCYICDVGAKILAEALQHKNCKVNSIDLSGNKIGPEGAKAIAAVFKNSNFKLTYINLGSNKIGLEGAKAIAEASKDPNCLKQLTRFHVDYEDVGQDGVAIIADAYKNPACNMYSLSFLCKEIEVKAEKGCVSTAESSTSLGSQTTDCNAPLATINAVITLLALQGILFNVTSGSQNLR